MVESCCITQQPDSLLLPGWPHSSVPERGFVPGLIHHIGANCACPGSQEHPQVRDPCTQTLTCTWGVRVIQLHPEPPSSLLLPLPPHCPANAAEPARRGRREDGKRDEEVPQEGEQQPPTTMVGKVGGLRLWGRGWKQGREGFSLWGKFYF